MIATLRIPRGTATLTAVLNDDLVWISADPMLEDYLRTVHPADDSRVSDGIPGRLQAMQAAKALDGKAEFPPDPVEEEGGEEIIH